MSSDTEAGRGRTRTGSIGESPEIDSESVAGNVRNSRSREIDRLTKLIAVQATKIATLAENEATLLKRIDDLQQEKQKSEHLQQLKWDRFLVSPIGWVCRAFFRLVLIVLRAINLFFGTSSPRLRAVCLRLEAQVLDREWRSVVSYVLRGLRRFSRTKASTFLDGFSSFTQKRYAWPISVVVIAEGELAAVMRTISSVREQTVARVQIIVVRRDDRAFATESIPYPQIVLQPGSAIDDLIKRGIASSKGKYICCLYAGDEIRSTYLEKCIFVLEDDPSIGIAYAHPARQEDGAVLRDFDAREPMSPLWIVPHAVFRREHGVKLAGQTKQSIRSIEDSTFWMDIAGICQRGRLINEPLVEFGRAKRPKIDVGWASSKPTRWFPIKKTPPSRQSWFPRFGILHRRIPDLGDARPHMLVAVPWLPYGGAEILLFEILQSLSKTWRLSIITTTPGTNDMAPRFATLTSDIFDMANLVSPESLADFLVAIAKSRRSKIILSSNLTAYYKIVSKIKSRLPRLNTIDILHNDAWHIGDAVAASSFIDRHVAVSYRVGMSLIKRGVKETQVAIIPNGVDLDGQFDPGRVDRGKLRRQYDVPQDAFVLTFVGRLAHEKHPDAFLEILEMLTSTPSVLGLMVGEGPLSSEVQRTVMDQQLRVRLIARVDRERIQEIYAISDLLIVTSEIEGMPLAVLEALAMGCPVAATAAGDLSRIIIDDHNGYLVPFGSHRSLVSRIQRLASDVDRLAEFRVAARASVRAAGATKEAMIGHYNRLASEFIA